MAERAKLKTIPGEDGFHMPGEYEPHRGCVMIWPVRPGSWPYGAHEAQQKFAEVARVIAESETVWMLVPPGQSRKVRKEICREGTEASASEQAVPGLERIHLLEIETDDAWARDVGPTCVVNDAGEVRGIDWQFNAWGGAADGLYAHWEKDNQAAEEICAALGIGCYDAQHFVLEGGSIHADGEGTVLVTEACLLSAGRNPQMTKGQIEETLKQYLGAEKVIWLPRGIWQDETNEHVDNICTFIRPGEVVLAWTDDREDPQWKLSHASLQVLERETDAKGRKILVHKLPIPQTPVCITEEELAGFVFEEGEDIREAGERLAASYVNFYLSNEAVLVPQFSDAKDGEAVQILDRLFPDRKIVPIDARPIIVGGGNIHCITQQIPLGRSAAAQKTAGDAK